MHNKTERPELLDRDRYRGYTIRINPFNGHSWIERDGACICRFTTSDDARQKIDTIAEQQNDRI